MLPDEGLMWRTALISITCFSLKTFNFWINSHFYVIAGGFNREYICITKVIDMKLNYTLQLCYMFCLGMVLSVQPMRVNQAVSGDQVTNCIKVEKSVAQQDAELLHSELLFK